MTAKDKELQDLREELQKLRLKVKELEDENDRMFNKWLSATGGSEEVEE